MSPQDKKAGDSGVGGPQNHNETPDERGERPTDPNELAKWIVEQTTAKEERSNERDSDS